MNDCIFCKIVKKELSSYIVYENDLVLAFFDIFPSSLGHTLIIPKKHYVNIFDIPEKEAMEIMRIGKKLIPIYEEVLDMKNVQLLHSAGKDGGQEVFHFHMHLIPRKEGDGIGYKGKPDIALREGFEKTLDLLKDKIGDL